MGVPAFVGEALGMQVSMLAWRGINGVLTYQLHGLPDLEALRNIEYEEIQINRAIIYLLAKKRAGRVA